MQQQPREMSKRVHCMLNVDDCHVKKVDGREFGVIKGLATTPTPDRYGDIVVSEGAKFLLPLSMLWQHVSFWPVGNWTAADVSKDGIAVEGEMPLFAEGRVLRERIEEAWESVKLKLVRGLSIGFRPLDYSWQPEIEGYEFREWEWLETSLVTIPANAEATIQVIRACDLAANKPALGLAGEVVRMDAETMTRVRADSAKRAAMEKRGAFFRK